MRILSLAVLLLLPFQVQANTLSKVLKKAAPIVEHLTLGAGTEFSVSQAAGGPRNYGAGLVATALVAGFKEGTDWHDHKDTFKQATFHFFTIVAGGGIMAAARHGDDPARKPHCHGHYFPDSLSATARGIPNIPTR